MHFAKSPLGNSDITVPMSRQMKRYRCVICDHIYDPREGDPTSGIKPGTAFEDLPDTWVCPDCGASKADYEPLDD